MKILKTYGLKPALSTLKNRLCQQNKAKHNRLYESMSSPSPVDPRVFRYFNSKYVVYCKDSVSISENYISTVANFIVKNKLPPDIIYTDELRNGRLLFKPDYAPDNLESHNYFGNCICVSRHVFDETFFELAEGQDIWAMSKYLCSKQGITVCHVPVPLFSDDYEEESNPRMPLTQEKPLISIIIPNKDHVTELETCIDSIVNINNYDNYEIIVVENGSAGEKTWQYYRKLEAMPELKGKFRLLKWEREFNYAAINNFAVCQAEGELILLLNNDTKIIEPASLNTMAALALREGTGAVGACLLYPNKTIQHAGIIVGIGPDKTAVHPSSGVPYELPGYRNSIHNIQNYSAVTGACLMVRRSLYERFCMDENLAVAYNDVDFCLNLQKNGYLNVYNPFALLYHFESVSRGRDDGAKRERFLKEAEYFRDKWQIGQDRYYNVNLSKDTPWEIDFRRKG